MGPPTSPPSTLDLFRAYYNIELDPASTIKTAVARPWGISKFKRLSMGLKNAAQSFHLLHDMCEYFLNATGPQLVKI